MYRTGGKDTVSTEKVKTVFWAALPKQHEFNTTHAWTDYKLGLVKYNAMRTINLCFFFGTFIWR